MEHRQKRRGIGELQIVHRVAGTGDVEHARRRFRRPQGNGHLDGTDGDSGVQRCAEHGPEQVKHAENEQAQRYGETNLLVRLKLHQTQREQAERKGAADGAGENA